MVDMCSNKYIDTHVHLYDMAFDADLNQVLQNSKEAGVVQCIFPAIDKASYAKQTEVAARCAGFVFEAMGLHPTSVGENWREELNFVKQKLEERNGAARKGILGINPYVAIGEIGIDGHWSQEFMKEQKEVFREQLLLARQYNLPVIVHVRDATNEIFEVLESMKEFELKGVFHAFSGSVETYRRLKKYGDIKVGMGGVVTYKNAGVANALEQIPLHDILLETDAPWLAPVPYRGKRNESSYIPVIAEKISQIKGCSLEEVAQVTTANARKLFGIGGEGAL